MSLWHGMIGMDGKHEVMTNSMVVWDGKHEGIAQYDCEGWKV